ncbi:hypothetical protein [Actinomyces faecalis]|uniref:hypothetical protein n=1 Tax=Actinomyces faecalis TaxID=2722820 RepID=UPI0015516D35|nr:hypothetical protein [Actinomyces faecalis]
MSDDVTSTPSPFTRPAFIVSAVMLLALVVGAVALWLTGSDPAPNTPTDVSVSQAGAPVAGNESDSVCGLAPGDQSVPTTPLGVDTIEIAPGLVVPSVDGAGPGVTDGVTRCYAHSPRGAVVAAASWIKWMSSRQQLDVATETLLAPGSDRDRLLEEVRRTWDGSTGSAVTVTGYKVKVRSTDEVLVSVAATDSRQPGLVVAWPLVMVWVEGDWKVQPPANDEWGMERVDQTAEGFVPWYV